MRAKEKSQILKSLFSIFSILCINSPTFAAFNLQDPNTVLLAQNTSTQTSQPQTINHNASIFNAVSCNSNSGSSSISFMINSFSISNSVLSSHLTSKLNSDNNVDLALTSSSSTTISTYSGNGDGSFSSPASKTIPSSASFITSADINNDGLKDLLTLSKSSNGFSYLLNNGNLNFQQAVSFNDLSSPSLLSTGDINNDGLTDVFILDRDALYLYLNFGTSNLYSFGFPLDIPFVPNYFTLADFNQDGNLDIACSSSSSNISIFYGGGNGNFTSQDTVPLSARASSVVVTDLNNDRKLDLVAAVSNQIAVSFGNNLNKFDSAIYLNIPSNNISINIANLNGDCFPDIISTNDNRTFSVLKNNGDKSFSPSIEFSLPSNPVSTSIDDFNNDFKSDIAFSFADSVKIYLNSDSQTNSTESDPPNGCLSGRPTCSDGSLPQCITGSPFCGSIAGTVRYGCLTNGMIILDMVTCPRPTPTPTPTPPPAEAAPPPTTTAAMSSNNRPVSCEGGMVICPGTSDPQCLEGGNPFCGNLAGTVRYGCLLNGMIYLDKVTCQSTSTSSTSSTSSSSSSSGIIVNTTPFEPNNNCLVGTPFNSNTTKEYNFIYNPYNIGFADFNNDQNLDFAISNSSDLSVFIKNDNDTYGRIVQNASDANYIRFTGRVDNDNIADILALSNTSKLVFIKGSLVSGRYLSYKFKEYNLNPFNILVSDINKDGNKEIFLLTYALNTVNKENKITIISGNDYTSTSQLTLGGEPTSFISGDFNGDSIQDLVTLDTTKKVSAFLGMTDGTLSNPTTTTDNSLNEYSSLIKGDFNRDGNLDIGIRYFSQGNTIVNIYSGDGNGSFNKIWTKSYPVSGEVYAKDVNRDSKPDLIFSGQGSVTTAPSIFLASGNGNGTFSNNVKLSDNLIVLDFLDSNEDSKVDLITRTPAYQQNITQKLVTYTNRCMTQSESASSSGSTSGTTTTSSSGGAKDCLANFPYYDSPDRTIRKYFYSNSFFKGDFNGDSKLDIALAGNDNYLGTKKALVLYNNGNGFTESDFDNGGSSATNDNYVKFLSNEDLNNDNISDLITGTAHLGFKVFLGRGDKTFTQVPADGQVSYNNNYGSFYMSGGNVNEVFVGDLDGDNYKDIIYQSGRGLLIYSGHGWQINYEKSFLLNFSSALVGLKDFNGDNRDDLIISRSGFLYIIPSMVNFSFDPDPDNIQANGSTIFGVTPTGIVTGDFNKDNKNDIAFISGSNKLTVLSGNGNGSFNSIAYTLNDTPTSIKAEDVDKDSRIDFVCSVAGSTNLLLLINNGDGTYTRVKSDVLQSADDFIIGNYSSNNKPDLVKIDRPTSYETALFIHNNYLCMTLGTNSTTSSSSGNTSGTTTSSGAPPIHTNNICPGNLPFGRPRLLYTGYTPGVNKEDIVKPISLVGDDFNNDNVLDFAIASDYDYQTFKKIEVVFGNTNNTFDPPVKIESNYGGKLVSGDFNKDGIRDIASADRQRAVYLGMANGSFTKVGLTNDPDDDEITDIDKGDFNADGKDDLVISYPGPWGAIDQSFIKIFTNFNATQTISPTINEVRIIPQAAKAGNLNNDSYSDLIVLGRDTQAVFSFINNMGTLGTQRYYRHNFNAKDIAIKDVNNDGISDLVIAGYNIISVFLGLGNGVFNDQATVQNGRRINLEQGIFISSIAVDDFTGDGRADIAINNTNGAEFLFLTGNGDGSFENTATLGSGNLSPQEIISVDLDNDNKKDLALVNNDQFENYPQEYKLALFKNGNCSSGFLPPPNIMSTSGEISKRLKACIEDTGLAKYPNRLINLNLGEDSVEISSVSDNDFNNDGKKDFALSYNSITLTGAIGNPTDSKYEAAVILNNGWNSFTTKKLTLPVPAANQNPIPTILSSNDLNNDGKNDLLINTTDGTSIYPGVGNGTFGNAQIVTPFRTNVLTTLPTPQTDFPGLVTLSPGMDTQNNFKLDTYIHDMSMNSNPFTFNQTFSVGAARPTYVTSRDLNADSRADIILSTESGTIVFFRKGNGDYDSYLGSDTSTVSRIGSEGGQLLTNDFNNDGKIDLAIIRTGNFSIYFGDGSGSLTKQASYTIPKQSSEFKQNYEYADINNDNIKDFIFSSRYGNLVIYEGASNGTFSFTESYRQGENGANYWFESPYVEDANNDGKKDLISLGYKPVTNMGMYFNKGLVGIYFKELCGDNFMIVPPDTTSSTSSTTSSSSSSSSGSMATSSSSSSSSGSMATSSSSSGGLTCSTNQIICSNMCVNGNCCSNSQCNNGKVCINNSCTCSAGQIFCNGGCVVGNCCSNSDCTDGKTCQANTCTTPPLTPTYGFTKTFTDSLEITGSASDSQNNIYVAGSGKLRKISPTGAILWQKNIVSKNISSITSKNKLFVDRFNNLYLIGTFSGVENFNPDGNDLITASGAYNAYISKFLPDGSYGWTKTIGGLGSDSQASTTVNGVTVDTIGNVFITGSFDNNTDFDPESGKDVKYSIDDSFYLTKINKNGSYAWTRISTKSSDFYAVTYTEGLSITSDCANNIYVAGSFSGKVKIDNSNPISSQGVGSDIFVSCFNNDGVFKWVKYFDEPAPVNNSSVKGIIGIDNTGEITLARTNKISHLSTNRDEIWSKNFTISDLTVDSYGNIYDVRTEQNGGQSYSPQIRIDSINKDGGINWSRFIGKVSNSSIEGFTISTDSNNDVIVGGTYSGSFDFDFTNGDNTLTSMGLTFENGYFTSNPFITKIRNDSNLFMGQSSVCTIPVDMTTSSTTSGTAPTCLPGSPARETTVVYPASVGNQNLEQWSVNTGTTVNALKDPSLNNYIYTAMTGTVTTNVDIDNLPSTFTMIAKVRLDLTYEIAGNKDLMVWSKQVTYSQNQSSNPIWNNAKLQLKHTLNNNGQDKNYNIQANLLLNSTESITFGSVYAPAPGTSNYTTKIYSAKVTFIKDSGNMTENKGLFSKVNEALPANNNNYIHNEGGGTLFLNLSNTPADFASLDSISYNIVHKVRGSVNYAIYRGNELSLIAVGGGTGGEVSQWTRLDLGGTSGNWLPSSGNGGIPNTKAIWDDAKIIINVDGFADVSAIQLIINYTKTNGTKGTAILRPDADGTLTGCWSTYGSNN